MKIIINLSFLRYMSGKKGAVSTTRFDYSPSNITYLLRQFKIHRVKTKSLITANGNQKSVKGIIAVLTLNMV